MLAFEKIFMLKNKPFYIKKTPKKHILQDKISI